MAGQPGRSGGANALRLAEQLAKGSFRPDRHDHLKPAAPPRKCSAVERRRSARGRGLLDTLGDWDASSLATVREYGLSLNRLQQFRDADSATLLHRELRLNLQLRKSLALEHLR